MIEAQGLTKGLGGRVVDDVSFRCGPGHGDRAGDRAWFEQTTVGGEASSFGTAPDDQSRGAGRLAHV